MNTVRMRRLAGAAVGIGLLLALVAAARAPADVRTRMTAERASLAVPGASATVRFDPLRISFAGRDGATVLRQLRGRAGAEQLVPSVPRSQFGAPGPPAATLYAPFSFLVGDVTIDQYPSFQWNGNLDTVTEGGTEYGAVAVERARRRRSGLRMVVSTSDPSGRRLIVDVRPGPGPGTIAVEAKPDDPTGVAAMGDSFASPQGQAFRGFGGRHDSLDQAGSEFYNWTQQENLSAPGLGGPAPPGSRSRHIPVPERRARRLLRAVVVHLAGPLRLPPRPRRALRLAARVRPSRRLAGPGRSATPRLRRRPGIPAHGDSPADGDFGTTPGTTTVGDRPGTRPARPVPRPARRRLRGRGSQRPA